MGERFGSFNPFSIWLWGERSEISGHVSFLNTLTVSAVSILGVIGLIVVFSTGLLLDLCAGPMYRLVEAHVLAKHIRQHQTWFKEFMDRNEPYIQQDYSLLLAMPTFSQLFIANFTLWKKQSRERVSFRKQLEFRRSYVRLSSFMLGYVSLAAGADKVEILGTQMALWNTSRAIGVGLALGLIAFMVGGFWLAPFSFDPSVAGFQIANLIISCVAYFLSIAAFDRFSSTLFALIYVIDSRDTPPPNRE